MQNAVNNPITSATGLSTPACLAHPVIRRFSLQVAGEGDRQALDSVEAVLIPKPGSNPRGDIQRPSMAQDILKGRRTEIERGTLKPSPSHLGG